MTPSQISANHATRTELPSNYGPLATLRARPSEAAKATALLVPGYTGSKEDFVPLLDPLAAAGFDTCAIDLPGQFESPGPEDPADYLPDALGGLIAEQIGKLAADGNRVLLLGHSYGGLVARAAVLAGAPISGLTLLDSGPAALESAASMAALRAGEPILRTEGTTGAWGLRVTMLDADGLFAGLPDELKDFLRLRFIRSTVAGLIGMADGLCYAEDQVPELARSLAAHGTPCLVICGADENVWPPRTQRDMAERLDADFALLPDCGHSPNTENPAALLATLIPTWNAWLD